MMQDELGFPSLLKRLRLGIQRDHRGFSSLLNPKWCVLIFFLLFVLFYFLLLVLYLALPLN